MRYRRNINTPTILHIYPAEYNRDNLKGDFMVEKRRPVGTLADIRKAFPDAILHIHLSDRVLVSEPIEGMTILRDLPTLEKLKKSQKEGARDAIRYMPWRSIGFRRGEYPVESITGEDIKGEWEVAKDDFLPFLQRELEVSKAKLDRASAALSAQESYDPYSGRHLSEWEAYFKARHKTLKRVIAFLSNMSSEEYQAYVYSRKLLASVINDSFVESQTFSTQFLDRVLKGERPVDVWNWHLNLFKQYIPQSAQKRIFNSFRKHITAWALQHYNGEIYENICQNQNPEKEVHAVLELWKGFPQFEKELKKYMCKYSSYNFWTLTCAQHIFEVFGRKLTPTRELLSERVKYAVEVVAPAFARICPAAADDLILQAKTKEEDIIRIYKL